MRCFSPCKGPRGLAEEEFGIQTNTAVIAGIGDVSRCVDDGRSDGCWVCNRALIGYPSHGNKHSHGRWNDAFFRVHNVIY